MKGWIYRSMAVLTPTPNWTRLFGSIGQNGQICQCGFMDGYTRTLTRYVLDNKSLVASNIGYVEIKAKRNGFDLINPSSFSWVKS
jgi:hypothetical protein